FILFGAKRIAAEVKNTFDYDYNHFNLDYFYNSHWVFDVENKCVTILSTEDEGANNEVHE
ncbi:2459_t:CDS:2, partial [Gigaspora rosea]